MLSIALWVCAARESFPQDGVGYGGHDTVLKCLWDRDALCTEFFWHYADNRGFGWYWYSDDDGVRPDELAAANPLHSKASISASNPAADHSPTTASAPRCCPHPLLVRHHLAQPSSFATLLAIPPLTAGPRRTPNLTPNAPTISALPHAPETTAQNAAPPSLP